VRADARARAPAKARARARGRAAIGVVAPHPDVMPERTAGSAVARLAQALRPARQQAVETLA